MVMIVASLTHLHHQDEALDSVRQIARDAAEDVGIRTRAGIAMEEGDHPYDHAETAIMNIIAGSRRELAHLRRLRRHKHHTDNAGRCLECGFDTTLTNRAFS